MDEEAKWKNKIKEILRRSEKYACARVRFVVGHNERSWWWERWKEEYHNRVIELSRLAGL